MSIHLSRRRFLSATGAALAAPYVVPSSVFGAASPSNRLNIGCIGVGNQGSGHLGALVNNPDVRVLAVCEVDALRRAAARQRVEKTYAQKSDAGSYKGCAEYGDFRELIARKDIDAVLIAVPDHWHALVSLAAIRAGKDVYCEKPLTLTITEGRVVSDAVKRYGRIFQTGSQQRSSRNFRYACELVRNGRIGKLKSIWVGLPPQNANPLGPQPEQPVPPYLDYNMWLGQAPYAPYNVARVHYYFRFLLDYSGGQMTNFGAHDLDIAQWSLDMDNSGPVEIEGKGVFPKNSFYTTATHVDINYTYANGVVLTLQTKSSGVRWEGSEGWIFVNRGTLQAEPKSLLSSVIGPSEVHLYDSKSHWGNFLECVKTRKQPICTAEIGHRSATVCHLGNIAMLLGRKLKWDPAKEQFINDWEADRMRSRVMRAPWYL